MKKALIGCGALTLLIALIAFAAFVWPTRYRYSHYKQYPIREDRFTGKVEYLIGSEWKTR